MLKTDVFVWLNVNCFILVYAFVDIKVSPESKPQKFSWISEKLVPALNEAIAIVNLFNFLWVSGNKISRQTCRDAGKATM